MVKEEDNEEVNFEGDLAIVDDPIAYEELCAKTEFVFFYHQVYDVGARGVTPLQEIVEKGEKGCPVPNQTRFGGGKVVDFIGPIVEGEDGNNKNFTTRYPLSTYVKPVLDVSSPSFSSPFKGAKKKNPNSSSLDLDLVKKKLLVFSSSSNNRQGNGPQLQDEFDLIMNSNNGGPIPSRLDKSAKKKKKKERKDKKQHQQQQQQQGAMLIADPDTERLNDPETTTDPLSEFKKYMLKNPPKIPITSSLSDYGYKYASQDISQDTAQDASNNNSTSTNSTTSTSKFFTKAKTKTKTKITTKTEGKENETNSINSEQKKLVASLNFGKKLEVTSR